MPAPTPVANSPNTTTGWGSPAADTAVDNGVPDEGISPDEGGAPDEAGALPTSPSNPRSGKSLDRSLQSSPTADYFGLRVNIEQATGSILHARLPVLTLPELATLDSVREALLASPLAGETHDIFFPKWTKTLYVTRSDDATLENVLNIETDEALRELLEEERSFPGKFAIRLEQCKNEKYSRFRREIPQASTTSCSSSVSSGSSAHENAITGKQHPSSAGLSKVRQGGRRSVCRLALQQQGHHCIRPSSSKAGRKTKGPSSASGDDRCFDGPTISHASCGAASREVAATTSAPTGPYFLPGRAVQNGQPFFGEPEGVDGQFYASHGNFYMQNQQGFSGPSGVYPHVGPVILYCPQPMHPLNGYAYPPYPFY